MRVSRERRAACPVNINLSAQWSYHGGRLGRNFDVTDGGGALSYLEQCPTKTAVCATRPREPSPPLPPFFPLCHRCPKGNGRKCGIDVEKGRTNDIISNHHARWVDPWLHRGTAWCHAARPSRGFNYSLIAIRLLCFRYYHFKHPRARMFPCQVSNVVGWSSKRSVNMCWCPEIRAIQRPRRSNNTGTVCATACRKLLNYSGKGESTLRRCYSTRNACLLAYATRLLPRRDRVYVLIERYACITSNARRYI